MDKTTTSIRINKKVKERMIKDGHTPQQIIDRFIKLKYKIMECDGTITITRRKK